LISRSQPKILRKIQKNLRRYISGISRFLHVCYDKAHSQVLMLHLSMHFNTLPLLKFIGGKQNLPFQTHIVNAPGMDEFLCRNGGLP